MAKVKPHEIDKKEKQEAISDFFEVIEKLGNKKEMLDFFLGLLTSSEALMLARRIQIAQLLIDEKSYEEIQKKLKVGSQTIHRTDKWINNGDDKVVYWLKNILKGEVKEQKGRYKNFSESLLNKYPAHRFWSDLFQ
jgi:TrpR-related protein YerC/YecD